MALIDCCLLSDGPADAALIPILEWVVEKHIPNAVVKCDWADLRRLPSPPTTLDARIRIATELFPCQILFVHRDAENQPADRRYDEIGRAITTARGQGFDLPHVCVVPVRMQEAWMLLEEAAIRRAAGNPNGTVSLTLPQANRIESIPDAKDVLYGLIRTASGLDGRRLKKLRLSQRARIIAQHMQDFSLLRALSAFRRLEADLTALALQFN